MDKKALKQNMSSVFSREQVSIHAKYMFETMSLCSDMLPDTFIPLLQFIPTHVLASMLNTAELYDKSFSLSLGMETVL